MAAAQSPASSAQLQDAPVASVVSYAPVSAAEGCFHAELNRLLESGAKRFCDVGGGAKPIVSLAQIRDLDLDYVVFDESQTQLEQAPAGYQHFCGDVLDRNAVSELVGQGGPFDVVLSRWTAEHMADGEEFHTRVFELLRPGGTALHFFPTLYALPFVLNRVLSHRLSSALLFRVFKHRKAKFPAYYSWCRGPTRRQLARLGGTGLRVERYIGFFGHGFYASVKPVHLVHRRITDLLLAHPRPSMTSFALVVLTRPE